MSSADDAYVTALQAALAGEHAAIWGSGRAAAELSGRQQAAALAELDEHRRTRDGLRAQVLALGARPVEAAPAYVEPFDVGTRAAAHRLLAHVWLGLAETYADLAAAAPPAGRQQAARAAVHAAVTALRWGADPQAFPGR